MASLNQNYLIFFLGLVWVSGGGVLVRDALVSALVCVCVVVARWSRVWLVCHPWLSCVFCVAAFGCNAVSCDFV